MGILKDIKELVGINTEEEYDDEVVEETSRTLSKRDMMITVLYLLTLNNLKIVKK